MVQRYLFIICYVLFLSVPINAQLQSESIEDTDINYLVEVYTSHSAGSEVTGSGINMEGMYLTLTGFLANQEYTECPSCCNGNTWNHANDYIRYYCSVKNLGFYLTTNQISNITFTFETTCKDAEGNIDHDMMDQSYSFRFNSYGVNFLDYDINTWSSGVYDYKAVGVVAVHPLYLLTVSRRFNKVGNNLPIYLRRKVFTYSSGVPSDVEDILDDGEECSFDSQYDMYLEVKLASEGDNAWRRLNYDVYDPQDNSYRIPYSAITSAFGSTQFVGKECKIRLHQGIEKEWASQDISFYYLPAIEINDLDIEDVTCSYSTDGHLDVSVGGFTSPAPSPFQYLYLLYKYSREHTSSNLDEIRWEDREECLYENGQCTPVYFEYPYISSGDESLTTSFDIDNLPAGIYKLKAYTVYSSDTTNYYPADTVFEIKAPDDVTFNTNFEYDWSGYHIPTGQNSAKVTLQTSGGWGNTYRYNLNGSGWSSLYTNNITISAQQSSNHQVCVRDASGCLSQPNCKSFAFNAPNPIVFGTPSVNIPSCNKLNTGNTNNGNATINITGGLPPFRIENVIEGEESLPDAINEVNQCFTAINSLPAIVRSNATIRSILAYYNTGTIIGNESEIITIIENQLDNCGIICTAYPQIITIGEDLIDALENLRDNFLLEQDREFDFDNLSSGSYKLSVIDKTSRVIFETTYNIGEPELLEITSVDIPDIDCWYNMGEATISSNNSNIQTYYARRESTNGITHNTTGSFTDLYPNEEYTFYFTNNSGCTSLEYPDNIPATPSEIIVSTSTTEASCVKAMDGEAQISASGGTHSASGYRIEKINPLISDTDLHTSKLFSDLATGTDYAVRITDDLGCVAYDSFDISLIADTLHITSVSPVDALCDELKGSIEITIDAGSRPAGNYTYSLLNTDFDPVTTINNHAQTSLSFSGYSPGDYYVEVSDITNCSHRLPVSIGTNSNQIYIDNSMYTASNTVCEGVSSGAISATATGGFPSGTTYHYFLEQTDGDESRSASLTGQVNFSMLPAGTYQLIIADDSSCYDTINNIHIGVEGKPVSVQMLEIQDQYCDEHRASINVTASSSTGDINNIMLRYPNNITETISSDNTAFKGGLIADEDDYLVRITDETGCTKDTLFTINNLHNDPVITINIIDSAACNTATNGSIEISATQPSVTDILTFRLGTNEKTNPVSVSYDNLGIRTSSNMYQISVTDTMGCSSDTSITFSAITHPIQISGYMPVDASCIRAANAGYHVESYGGMPDDIGIHFILNNLDTIYGNNVDFEGYPVTGNNRIRAYDSYGCYNEIGPFWFTVRTDSLDINVNSVINASCPNYSDGQVEVQAVNGNPYLQGYYYRVINNNTQNIVSEDYGSITNNISDLPLGQYFVEVTDEDNCLANSTEFNIEEPDAPILTVSPGYVAQKGDNTGWINANISDGNGNYNIEWYAGTIDIANLISSETTTQLSSVNNLNAGSYTVRIQDTAECVFWDDAWFEETVEVYEPEDSLKLDLIEMIPVSCNGLSDGQFVLAGTGGWGDDYLYGSDIGNINQTSAVFSDFAAGTSYIFYTRDTSGIVASISLDMTEPEVLTTSVNTINHALCFGASNGEVELNISGGNETYYVSTDETNWSEGNVVEGLTAGDYNIFVRDELGCTALTSATINEPTEIVVTDTSITNTKCQVNEGIISASINGGTPSYIYRWYQNNELLEQGNSTIDSLFSGVYNLQIEDANNCLQEFTFHISDLTDLEIESIITEPVTCWGGNDGNAAVNIINGNPPYLIIWPDSTNETSVNGLEAGRHLLSVYDMEGCIVFENFIIDSPDDLTLDILELTMPLCLGVADGNIEVIAQGGTPDYNYRWNTGRQNNTISGLDEGDYSVTITDENNCSREFEITLEYQEEIVSGIPSDLTVCNNNTYPLDPGEFEFYEWSDENGYLSSERILNIGNPGSYFIEFEDNRGCQNSDTIEVSVSETTLGAQMLMASVVHVGDTVVIFEASVPIPDSISLEMDESFRVIESGQYYKYITANDTGAFDITLTSYLNDCQDVITKTMYVIPDDGSEENFYLTSQQLIENVELYPNPSVDGHFALEIELNDISDVKLRMVSFGDGTTVDVRELNGGDYYYESFNKDDLLGGTYLLSIQAGSEMQNIKIIIL